MEQRKRKQVNTSLQKQTSQPLTSKSVPVVKRVKSAGSKAKTLPEDVSSVEQSVEISSFRIQDYLTDTEWKELLKDEFEKDYFKKINTILALAYKKSIAMPPKELVFNAFNSLPLKKIKCVIIGQDPYHDDGQAHGLAFSVPANVPLPRSLKNIFQELENDIPEFVCDKNNGCLEKWTKEGVFLLNTYLTVEAHMPGSHSKIGWSQFTDRVISIIAEKNDGCVFMLWGNWAHQKEALISPPPPKTNKSETVDAKNAAVNENTSELIKNSNHKVIKAAHPSPLSFNKFFNSKCFSQCNQHLKLIGKPEIDWSLVSKS